MTRFRLKANHKVGMWIVAAGALLLASSLAFPAIGSVLFIFGLALVFAGFFVIDPAFLP